MSMDGKPWRHYLPGLDEADRQRVCYAIYPNLLLSLHPDYMMTHSTLWPGAHDRTEIVCEVHFTEATFHPDDAIEFGI